MLSKRAYVDHLKGVRLFQDCSRKQLELIAGSSETVTMRAGAPLVEEGKDGREAFVILTGTATVRKKGRLVRNLGPGAMVGELSLLDRGPRTATVVCDTDCTVLLLTQGGLLRVIDEVPAISHKLFASLAGMIRDIDNRSVG